tara:strand:+ start:2349 stop:2855 length:507 start_codon:yes stop_codon:yes gene_type:complete
MSTLVVSNQAIMKRVENLASFYLELKEPRPALVTLASGGTTLAVDLVRILANKNITDFPFEVLAPGTSFTQQATKKLKNYNRILVIDDIFDTGQQLLESKKILGKQHDVFLAALLLKNQNQPEQLDWHGFTIPDVWVYGYGMDDVHGLNRALSDIVTEDKLPKGYRAP